jgi:hypothetical protein
MHIPRAAFDRTLQVFGWLLVAGFLFIVASVLHIWLTGSENASFFDSPAEWVMLTFFAANVLASVVGLLCVVFSSHVKEAKLLWSAAFLYSLATASNVVVVPLFRRFALQAAAE